MNDTLEQRLFEYLGRRQGVELSEACKDMPFFCSSVRAALNRLCAKGQAGSVLIGRVAIYFMVRNATKPEDRRGKRRGRKVTA